ncbi:hypothetical protein BVRB_6g139760 [Beta vulgaris subsp. vulgaris]|nr:hypothetical protein BVRB_6g139760 [Beta vulgaris subsp. vulgaris]
MMGQKVDAWRSKYHHYQPTTNLHHESKPQQNEQKHAYPLNPSC